MEINPAEAWRRNRVDHEPLSSIAASYCCSKNRIKLIVNAYRWKRGEVVIARQWMIYRIREGYTVTDMAISQACSERTIYLKLQQYQLRDLYCQYRRRGPGNPALGRRKTDGQ